VQDYQRAFVDFLRDAGALKVGEFRLKSGRLSPLFLNTALLDTGGRLAHLGKAYAETLLERVGAGGFDVVFGPAYKGIPLAVATVVALAARGADKAFLADRKEAKTHGAEAAEAAAGMLLGRVPAPDARFVLVDDVLTTGGTKYEAVDLLRKVAPRCSFAALLVVLDRQELAPDGTDAVRSFTERTGVPVLPVVTVTETLDHLAAIGAISPADLARCVSYWSEHGTEAARRWARRSEGSGTDHQRS
jgi:orotate phosphoribosyltransferase